MIKKCACIILNYNDADNVQKLLKKIAIYKCFAYIVVVDNASTDDSFKKLSTFYSQTDHIIVLKTDHNGGYGYGNNWGVNYSYQTLGCEYALIANPDVSFENDTIIRLLDIITSDNHIGIAAPTQLDSAGYICKNRGWKLPTKRQYIFSAGLITKKLCTSLYYHDEYFEPEIVDVDSVPGALLMVSCSAFFEVSGYDPNIFLYGEETTLGIKMQARGYRTVLLTNQTYRHMHSVSVNKTIKSRKKQLRLLFDSRLIILKKYMKASPLELAFARIFYSFVVFEYGIYCSKKK